jgi:hypothetical protein
VLIEIGKESVAGATDEALLDEAEAELIAEALR